MSLTPWSDGHERKKRNRDSRKQERERAREVGGSTRAGSGSSWRAPQDVRSPEKLEQLKFTDGDGFRIDAREWLRIRADALRDNREPVLVIEFRKHKLRLIVEEG